MANAYPGSDEILHRATDPTVPSTWSLPALVAFRFAFVYLILYCLRRTIEPFPYGEWVLDTTVDVARLPVVWFADIVLGIEITIFPAGSGDTTYNYVHVLVLALVAATAAAVWTAIAGRRHPRLLRDRLYVFLRFVLAATMLRYGFIKLFPAQFSMLQPPRLALPVGEMSPMGLLWTLMSYSPAYGFFTGAIEVTGGMLLFWRRTTTLGALVVAATMANVLALNLCYDVPVKLFSFHLLLVAIVLILPDARRLADVLVFHRPTAPAAMRAPFRSRWAERARLPVKLLVIAAALGTASYRAHESWNRRSGTPRTGVGYYNVETFVRGGVPQPRNLDDASQWRSFAISQFGYATICTMQGPPRGYDLVRIPLANVMVIVRVRPGEVSYGWLLFRRDGDDRLGVRGLFDGVPIEAHMKRNDGTTTELMRRGFHWINEYPYNR
jgi:hypothetical protein